MREITRRVVARKAKIPFKVSRRINYYNRHFEGGWNLNELATGKIGKAANALFQYVFTNKKAPR